MDELQPETDYYKASAISRLQADLNFHVKVLKSCFIQCIEVKDIERAQKCYNQLTSLHFKPEVSKDLLPFGVQLIKLSESSENSQFQIKDLLQNLIALKGTYLISHVTRLAEIHLREDNIAQAIALIKTKLSGKESRNVLESLNLC
jgi:hypothetical protein